MVLISTKRSWKEIPQMSKSDWVFERSSGYAGYRCQNCGVWIDAKTINIGCVCEPYKAPFTLVYEDRWDIKIARVRAVSPQDIMKSKYGENVRFIFHGHSPLEGESSQNPLVPIVEI